MLSHQISGQVGKAFLTFSEETATRLIQLLQGQGLYT